MTTQDLIINKLSFIKDNILRHAVFTNLDLSIPSSSGNELTRLDLNFLAYSIDRCFEMLTESDLDAFFDIVNRVLNFQTMKVFCRKQFLAKGIDISFSFNWKCTNKRPMQLLKPQVICLKRKSSLEFSRQCISQQKVFTHQLTIYNGQSPLKITGFRKDNGLCVDAFMSEPYIYQD